MDKTDVLSPADRGSGFSAGLGPLLDSEEDPARLWAEIHLLRSAVAGPQGYSSWQEAATAERVRRVRAERALEAAQPKMPQWPEKAGPSIDLGRYAGTYGGTVEAPPPRTLWQRFQAWRERTGFLMDGRDGGM